MKMGKIADRQTTGDQKSSLELSAQVSLKCIKSNIFHFVMHEVLHLLHVMKQVMCVKKFADYILEVTFCHIIIFDIKLHYDNI